MPVLYQELGIPGRVLSCLFFLCISLAGISSLVAVLELPVHTLEEMQSKVFPPKSFSFSCVWCMRKINVSFRILYKDGKV